MKSLKTSNIEFEIVDNDNIDLSLLNKTQLLQKCKDLKIVGYSSKNKSDIIKLISNKMNLFTSPLTTNTLTTNTLTTNTLLSNNPLNFIDLFCGIGGFHQALKGIGTCVLACDIDKKCREVYKDNYGLEPVPNVKEIDANLMPDFDILCGGFPCFVAETLTLTNNGYKNIEDVEITDKLLTHQGNFQTILNLQRKVYTGNLFDLTILLHSDTITATEEHPFYIREKLDNGTFDKPIWKKAKDLILNDYFGMVINTNQIIPNNLTSLDDWFLMGYFLGNGYIKEEKQICFCIYHENVLAKISKVLPVVLKTGNLYSCENLGWLNILKHFDLQFDNFNPTIPEWIQDAPKSFIQEFINGFISSGCLKYFTPNIDLDFQRLGLKLGQIFKLNQSGLTRQPITYFGSRAFIENNYAWFAPVKIIKRPVSLVPVFNFEVDTDNSYVVQNICVHNCQSFSNAGKKKTFDDERGLLFDEIVRIAKVKRPRFMFLENVKHILKVGDGEVIEYIKNKILALGYHLQIFEISPHNYGIPQQRERVYFVCIRNDIYDGTDIVIPEYTGVMNFESYLDKIEDIDPKYFVKGDVLETLLAWDKMVTQFEVGEKISPTIMINDAYSGYSESDFQAFPDWKQDYVVKNKPLLKKYKAQFDPWYQENKVILKKREIYGKLEWQTGVIKENDSIFNHFIQIRQSGIRVKKAQYFPTLVAIAQIPIYGKEKRYITPRECARLQSFPPDFKIPTDDKVSYKQFGNSVNVDNVATIIRTTLTKYGVI